MRDKDAVDGAFLICEMFAYYKTRGISLIDKLNELYDTYGYCLNTLHSYTFEGSAGFEKMQSIMAAFRGIGDGDAKDAGLGRKCAGETGLEKAGSEKTSNAETEAGKPGIGSRTIEEIMDYARGLDGLPKSDVLKFKLADNCSVVVRPSGTEPKLKTYISVSAKDRESAVTLENEISRILAERMS